METDLTKKPIPYLIRQIALPASIGFFFNTMYNVVDTYWGGRHSTDALAALSLSFPIFFIILAMGSGIGTGATALISNALGEGNQKKATRYVGQATSFAFILGVIMTVVGLMVSPSLFRLLGADGTYLSLALSYMNVILLGSVFFMLIYTMNSILNSQGDAKTFRNYLIFGFFLNLILDPWFLYGGFGLPALGLPGIAWATVVVQFIGMIYMGSKAVKSELFCKDCLKKLKPDKKDYIELSKQGFPASLNMMTVAIGIFVITYFISQFGKQAVAAYGIATRIEQIVMLPSIGLEIAALAIIGQNNGAKRYDRVRETMKKSILYGVIILLIGTFAVFILAKFLMGIFTTDPAVVGIGTSYLRIAAFVFQAYVILYISTSSLQGMKRPLYAIWIGLYRQIAAPLLVFFLLVKVFSLGVVSVFFGIATINWSAALFTLWYAHHVIKRVIA